MRSSNVKHHASCYAAICLSVLLATCVKAQSDNPLGSFLKGFEVARQAALQRQQAAARQKYLDEQLRLQRAALAADQDRKEREKKALAEQWQKTEDYKKALASVFGQQYEVNSDFTIYIPMNRLLPELVLSKPEAVQEMPITKPNQVNNIGTAIKSMMKSVPRDNHSANVTSIPRK